MSGEGCLKPASSLSFHSTFRRQHGKVFKAKYKGNLYEHEEGNLGRPYTEERMYRSKQHTRERSSLQYMEALMASQVGQTHRPPPLHPKLIFDSKIATLNKIVSYAKITYWRCNSVFRVIEFALNTKLASLGLEEELGHFQDSPFWNPNRMVKHAAVPKLTGSCLHIIGTILLSRPLGINRQMAHTLKSRALG
ncbi:ribosomal RNA small subunit methyltransferase H [Striga asiatica]|uniref:Ribosomal RNA small subunit methyltransferase H n=1 Tax=Striga asiatica TaxID=4170 RepID=A0A5A7R6A4_STRAF|nr:ribosomal RNA small subunit methyltransferase H [Striga asiatica]